MTASTQALETLKKEMDKDNRELKDKEGELERKEAEKTADKTVTGSNEAWAVSLGGGATARLIDVSLGILALGGTSTARDAELDLLNPAHHDPAGLTLAPDEASADLVLEAVVEQFWLGDDAVRILGWRAGSRRIRLR